MDEIQRILLIRNWADKYGVYGTLFCGNVAFYTGELPWHDNKPDISCIPDGEYLVKWTWSKTLDRNTYEVLEVPKRTGIRIHIANYFGDSASHLRSDVLGCIGLGKDIETKDGQKHLVQSTEALARFESLMDGRDFKLKIINQITGGTEANPYHVGVSV